MAVASPSASGLVAMMTSRISPPATRVSSSLIRRSSGPTRFMGEMAPWSTWYSPLNSRERSMESTSRGSETTQTTLRSRLGEEQMGQSSSSVKFWQTGQVCTRSRASSTLRAKASASPSGRERM